MHHFDIPGEKDVPGIEVTSLEDHFTPCWYQVYVILETGKGLVPEVLQACPQEELVADIDAVMNEIRRASIGSTENYLQIAVVEGLCGKIKKVWPYIEGQDLVEALEEALVACYDLQQKK